MNMKWLYKITNKINGLPLHIVKNKRWSLNIEGASNSSWVSEREWTDYEMSKIKDESLTTETLVKILNISRNTIQKKRKQLGIKFNRKYKKDKHLITETMREDLLNTEISLKDLSVKYGRSSCTASRKRKSVLKEKEKRYNE